MSICSDLVLRSQFLKFWGWLLYAGLTVLCVCLHEFACLFFFRSRFNLLLRFEFFHWFFSFVWFCYRCTHTLSTTVSGRCRWVLLEILSKCHCCSYRTGLKQKKIASPLLLLTFFTTSSQSSVVCRFSTMLMPSHVVFSSRGETNTLSVVSSTTVTFICFVWLTGIRSFGSHISNWGALSQTRMNFYSCNCWLLQIQEQGNCKLFPQLPQTPSSYLL